VSITQTHSKCTHSSKLNATYLYILPAQLLAVLKTYSNSLGHDCILSKPRPESVRPMKQSAAVTDSLCTY